MCDPEVATRHKSSKGRTNLNYSSKSHFVNPFHATSLSIPPENIRKAMFSELFRRYRKTPVAQKWVN